ncbi:DUF4123 domain-containing protein [Pseudomonas putida]|uniref:DUF4123 domain-containing protein n=1 Tax=Pseudomonas putida TaxID=303 RepID=UPI0023666DEE|nr:DUF4123 domain-containing protein [Pseudomonas putida]MDD2050812.1 DUF4123 domain-containing protein [Pseudomonas putida]
MNSVSQANYLLIDGVLRPDALASLYSLAEPIEIEPLYLATRWTELKHLGPLLVAVHGPSNLIDETYQRAARQADASLLSSPAPTIAVADHLRRFIAPDDVLGSKGLLRFADPLVARYWLGSYQGAQRDAVLGPIQAWHLPPNPHTWERAEPVEWHTIERTAPPPEWVDEYARLGEAQLHALDQAARWRFMERLHRRFEQDHPQHLAHIDKSQLSRWFDDRLDEAQAWGLVSEQSLAIWVEYSLRWGEGFTERPQTPYQHWLARTPEARKLAPELRIQHMDKQCLHLDLNKDA